VNSNLLQLLHFSSQGFDLPPATQGNIVERNHIHHLGNGELSDLGGIYALGVSTSFKKKEGKRKKKVRKKERPSQKS
jgi:hypothetical protein